MTLQLAIFVGLTGLIAFLTYLKCRNAPSTSGMSIEAQNKEVFLAGGGLTWVFVAGSVTLTNLSTDQLVG
ncbi:MAG: SLC5 family protein, partial [Pseudomonadota bacterium]